MGWICIRIRMDPELLPGSGFLKVQSWIRTGINHFGSTTLFFMLLYLRLPEVIRKKPPLNLF